MHCCRGGFTFLCLQQSTQYPVLMLCRDHRSKFDSHAEGVTLIQITDMSEASHKEQGRHLHETNESINYY